MIHNIHQGNFSAQISELGAELKSFKNETTGIEYIWYGLPEFWNGSAPILFPNVGLLKNDEYVLNGKTYNMQKHGFARKSYFELVDKTVSTVKFRLNSNDELFKIYPFEFELEVSFEISNSKLKITNTVKNNGSKPLVFTIGAHPAFNLNLNDLCLEDYYIEFDKKENLQLYELEKGLFKHGSKPFRLSEKNRITLSSDIFNNDALIFKNINSRAISIGCTKSDFKLTLINTGDAPHLGIWSVPGAPYVCIEPWHGHADMIDSDKDFIKKDGTIILDEIGVFISGYEILV